MRWRVESRILEHWCDPALFADSYFSGLAAGVPRIWLDNGADSTRGRSIVATPFELDRTVLKYVDSGTVAEAVFQSLSDELDVFELRENTTGFTALGWYCWLSYEFGVRLAGLTPRDNPYSDGNAPPDLAAQFVDCAVIFDHNTKSVTLQWLRDMSVGDQASHTDRMVLHADKLVELVQSCSVRSDFLGDPTVSDLPCSETPSLVAPPRSDSELEVSWRHGAQEYMDRILRCQSEIRAGDAYQLCLTNRITVRGNAASAAQLYSRLRASSPSHHGGFMQFGEHALLSSSPEQFLRVSGDGVASTTPIKGTRRRSDDPTLDAELKAELTASEKERAENIMIVDLMRNDFSRVCAEGTVRVSRLLDVEQYRHVHQLVSTVEGQIASGLNAFDVVRASFPAGSMTGAPKLSAIKILDELEDGPRGVYSGVYGYFSVDGSADLAMVIRSLIVTNDQVTIGTGGGITVLSVPSEEVDETHLKAEALVRIFTASILERP